MNELMQQTPTPGSPARPASRTEGGGPGFESLYPHQRNSMKSLGLFLWGSSIAMLLFTAEILQTC
jgi:hypothetical protein